jgi:hypothetical protein
LADPQVELLLVGRRAQAMARDPGRAGHPLKDRGVEVLALDLVAVDQLRPVPLPGPEVELLLVGGRRQAVAGDGRRTVLLLPDRGVTGFGADAVAADVDEAVALAGPGVELLLVGRRGQAVAGDEGRAVAPFPDRGVAVLALDGVAVDLLRAVALAGPGVELLLVGGRGQAVAGDEGRAGLLLPDGGVARLAALLVATDLREAPSLPGPEIELLLV